MRPLQKSVRVFRLASLCLLFATGQLFAASGSGSASAGVDQRGEVLALSCAGCHGTDGKSASIMPSVYGKDAGYIQSALIDFKAGTRMSTVMSRHAKGYTDEEIHLIADYFGNLSKKNK